MKKLSYILTVVFLLGCVDVSKVEGPIDITNHVDDWRDEVIYQLITDRFADGDVNNNHSVNKKSLTAWNGGDFQGIIDNIDYLKELGVTTLWISPVVKMSMKMLGSQVITATGHRISRVSIRTSEIWRNFVK